MKIKTILIISMLLMLNSCFLYNNSIQWQDSTAVSAEVEGEKIKKDSSVLDVEVELERKNRLFYLPFLCIKIHRNKAIYHPIVGIISEDQKVVKFYDLEIDLRTLKKEVIFQKTYTDTITLNVFDDYNAQLWQFNDDFIPTLKEANDSILINYSLKTIDSAGSSSTIEKQNLKYVRRKHKRFGSLF